MRHDIELCEIALVTAAPDCSAESENSHTVRTISNQQDERVAILEQQFDPVGEVRRRRGRFVELTVEVVKKPTDRISLRSRAQPDHLSSYLIHVLDSTEQANRSTGAPPNRRSGAPAWRAPPTINAWGGMKMSSGEKFSLGFIMSRRSRVVTHLLGDCRRILSGVPSLI
jgi:hypothetical protein